MTNGNEDLLKMNPPLGWTPEKVRQERRVSEAIAMDIDPKPLLKRILCIHDWVFIAKLLLPFPMNLFQDPRAKYVCGKCGASREMNPLNIVERI